MSGRSKTIENHPHTNPIHPGVSCVRFILILLIVFNHTGFGRVADGGFEKQEPGIWFNFTSPILAILSGWLFFNNIDNDRCFSKTKKRFFTILVPYVLWSVIYVIIHLVLMNVYVYLTGSKIWASPTPTWSLDYLLDAFWRSPIVGNFWYLKNILVIVPFNWVFLRMLNQRLVFEVFYFTVLCCLFLGVDLWFSDRFIPYYLIGCYAGFKKFSLKGVVLKRIPVTMGVLLLFIMLEIWIGKVMHSNIIRIPFILLMAMLGLGVLHEIYNYQTIRSLMRWEEHSFFIFAAHSIVCSVIGKLLILLMPSSFFQNPFVLSAMLGIQFIFTVLICVSLSTFTKYTSRSLWKLLIGGRSSS